MVRRVASLRIRPWADGGERVDPEDARFPLDRDEGFGLAFSQRAGPKVERLVFNQLLREITGALYEANIGGIFEWSAEVGYAHYAFVRRGDTLWRSKRSSGPGTAYPASEPGTDDETWREY